MTECNTTSVDFTPLGRSQMVADFLGGRLATDADAHQQTLCSYQALQTVSNSSVEEDQPLASPSTLCRLKNRITRSTLVQLSAILVEPFLNSFQQPLQEITLDFDATGDRVHG